VGVAAAAGHTSPTPQPALLLPLFLLLYGPPDENEATRGLPREVRTPRNRLVAGLSFFWGTGGWLPQIPRVGGRSHQCDPPKKEKQNVPFLALRKPPSLIIRSTLLTYFLAILTLVLFCNGRNLKRNAEGGKGARGAPVLVSDHLLELFRFQPHLLFRPHEPKRNCSTCISAAGENRVAVASGGKR
jgi:hypothetical protein